MTAKKDNAWIQGYACAIATTIRSHGGNTEQKDALKAGGITSLRKAKALGIDPYDIEALKPMLKEIEETEAYRKKMRKE